MEKINRLLDALIKERTRQERLYKKCRTNGPYHMAEVHGAMLASYSNIIRDIEGENN